MEPAGRTFALPNMSRWDSASAAVEPYAFISSEKYFLRSRLIESRRWRAGKQKRS